MGMTWKGGGVRKEEGKKRLAFQLLKYITELQKLKTNTEPKIGRQINGSEWSTKIVTWIYENLVCDKGAISNLWRKHGSLNSISEENIWISIATPGPNKFHMDQ